MLAPLLASRFHLALHHETRVVPVYLMVVAKGGPKFKAGDGGETSIAPEPSGGIRYTNYPMAGLANTLALFPPTGRPVLDRTGLTGRYTFTANLQEIAGAVSPGDLKKRIIDSDAPVFTTLQEQLGLKLNADRAPIEILIVDRADKSPTDD